VSALARRRRSRPHVDAAASWRLAVEHGLFGVVPIVGVIFLSRSVLAGRYFAVDFHQTYWVAGLRVLHGTDPYAWSHAQIVSAIAFTYAPIAALVFAPFALLPLDLSQVLFTALCLVAVPATLRLLQVKDWRLYGLAMIWPPVVAGYQTANLTLLLTLGLALAWRYRDRAVTVGLIAGLSLALKLFMWPVLVWLLATRRYLACAWAVAAAVGVNVIASAVLGFADFGQFIHLSSEVTSALYRNGYGAVALALHLGLTRTVGVCSLAGLSLLLLSAIVKAGRRGCDQRALVGCVALILVASPLIWTHYPALLLVPLAILRPRLGPAWLLGLVLWLCPQKAAAGWQVVLAWVVVGGILAVLIRTSHPASEEAARREAISTCAGQVVRRT
jgi:hypothetical protein